MPSSLLFPKWGSITTGIEVAKAQTMICKGTKWPSTYQSVNSGSLFCPQEVNKAFGLSTRDLEPFLWHEGHRNQLSFSGGGPVGQSVKRKEHLVDMIVWFVTYQCSIQSVLRWLSSLYMNWFGLIDFKHYQLPTVIIMTVYTRWMILPSLPA